ncbi:MAG: hypothetical protein KDJ52_33475 [Anaerolineae bacterium]|nr:hypothetical protein [Anaerolineae bacterium]
MIIATLTSFASQLPVILVWLAGFIMAIVFWRRHPRVSLLTVIAMVGFFINTLVGTYISLWLPRMQPQGWSMEQIGMAFAVSGFIRAFISAILWGLLLVAVFGWRGKSPDVSQEDANS